jgi:dipeptidyl aminopeptidase/acylaminoacyl peptidase
LFKDSRSWSPDSKFLLFEQLDPKTNTDLWILPVEGDSGRVPTPYLQTPFNETFGAISPDGHWVAYVSDESGAQEVYVRPFEGSGAAVQVSTSGGSEPHWIRDGRGIAFRTGELRRTFVAADVRTDAGFSVSAPRVLFTTDWVFGTLNHEFREWEISRDGTETFGLRAVHTEQPDRHLRIVTSPAEGAANRP